MRHLLATRYSLLTTLGRRSGQSLVEILVAIAVGVILITGAVALIVPSIRNNRNVSEAQVSAALGRELFENVRVLAEADWNGIAALATTSANRYYLVAGSPFTTSTGVESVMVATTTYQRSFYLDDVYRNVSGKIDESGTTHDPSTKKVTVVHTWPPIASSTLVGYLVRAPGSAFSQTDWSVGPGTDGPLFATGVAARFSTSTSIDYSTSGGAIFISGMAGP